MRDTALHFTCTKNNKLKSDTPQFSMLGIRQIEVRRVMPDTAKYVLQLERMATAEPFC
jgi:hypothetical protein